MVTLAIVLFSPAGEASPLGNLDPLNNDPLMWRIQLLADRLNVRAPPAAADSEPS